MFFYMLRFLLLLASISCCLFAQSPAWKNPFPPHKILGNVYYVGTEDLACFLITTPEGHILINTGLDNSAALIRDSIAKLGFKTTDIKILLTNQAHYDHVAAFAELQKESSAKVFATEQDAPILEDGGKSDPFFKTNFKPVRVDRKLKDGDTVQLGKVILRVHLTPGHTKGSVSYSTTISDNGRPLSFVFANMSTVVMPLLGNPKYPDIVSDFQRSFRVQKSLAVDAWVAAHASQYNMQAKLKTGSFIDRDGYMAAVQQHERTFRQKLEQEQKASAARKQK
jgi:metallo-beta-lactamase class B